ncbi:MAG TPA: hypothetical protein VGQ46_08940 [Thermoanaerobaculia bacterium]|nr:hypothetical protein [Thermoanaerobaculia bacterium]
MDQNIAKDVHALASLIGDRNFVSFDEIRARLGMEQGRVLLIKPFLESFLTESGKQLTSVTSHMRSTPPGLFIED